MDRLGRQCIHTATTLLGHYRQVGTSRRLGDHRSWVALLVDVAHGHPCRVAEASKRCLHPLAHQTVGLALRLEDFRTDIDRTFAKTDRDEWRRRNMDTDQLRREPLGQSPAAFDSADRSADRPGVPEGSCYRP